MSYLCCLCEERIDGFGINQRSGNSPSPLKEEGECCDKCNIEKVIPARMKERDSIQKKINALHVVERAVGAMTSACAAIEYAWEEVKRAKEWNEYLKKMILNPKINERHEKEIKEKET